MPLRTFLEVCGVEEEERFIEIISNIHFYVNPELSISMPYFRHFA